jgi:hypothetical protein
VSVESTPLESAPPTDDPQNLVSDAEELAEEQPEPDSRITPDEPPAS